MAMIWAVGTAPGSGPCLSESLLLLPQGQVLPLLFRAAQPSVTPTEPHPHSGVSWTHLLLTVEKEHLGAYGNEIPSWLDGSGAMKIPQGCSAVHGEVWHPPQAGGRVPTLGGGGKWLSPEKLERTVSFTCSLGQVSQQTVVSPLQTSFLSLPSCKTPYPRLIPKAPVSGAPLQPVPLLGFCFLPDHSYLYRLARLRPSVSSAMKSPLSLPNAPPHIQAQLLTATLMPRHCPSFDWMLLFAEPNLIHLLMFLLLYIANMCWALPMCQALVWVLYVSQFI